MRDQDVIEKRKAMGDLQWSLRTIRCKKYKFRAPRSPQQIKYDVLKSDRVQHIMSQVSEETGHSLTSVEKDAKTILEEMGHNQQLRTVRGFGYVLSKLMKQLYTGIYVNEEGIEKLRSVVEDYPILLMPTHRSYVDFLMLSYVCFLYDLPVPVIAAGLDFMGMKIVNIFLRNAGAFFIRRSFGSDRLYWSIFTEYVQAHILNGDAPIEFFVEGTRSRTAKSLTPKLGFLTAALEPFFKAKVTDMAIVPISISYDRTLEELLYTYELLGVPKPKESTKGLIKARQILDDCFGTINVRISDPIILSEFCKSMSSRRVSCLGPRYLSSLSHEEQNVCKALAFHVLRQHQINGVLLPFTLIASIFLSALQRGITDLSLLQVAEEVQWIKELICQLGGRMSWKHDASVEAVVLESARVHCSSLRILKDRTTKETILHSVQVQPSLAAVVIKKVADLKGHQLSSNTISKAVPCILLSHYSNQLLHVFVRVALVTMSLHSGPQEGCSRDFILSKYHFLEQLFSQEFVFEPGSTEQDCSTAIESLRKMGVIHQHSNTLQTHNSGERFFTFLCQLFDPFLIGYKVVCEILLNLGANAILPSCSVVVREAQACIERLLQNSHVTHYAVLSLDLLNNAILSVTQLGGLRREKRGNSCVLQCIHQELSKITSELDQLIHLPGAVINSHLEPLVHQPLAKL